ncbi:MAG: hypothetical protein LBT86_09465 [Deltaproteobacteria bacterium]|jgi:hypothetical protein|nr:hypothetical protein [Deltaproteobacteria bacterium]
MRLIGSAKKQKALLSELEKLAKKVGLKVSTGKLIYAGLKLKSGQCSLRREPWLIVDRAQPFEEQVELFRLALTQMELEPERIPDHLKEILSQRLPLDTAPVATPASAPVP